MVRGAYMDEERLLAKQKNYESPICETFQLTTESYHTNFENLIKNLTPKSEVQFLKKKIYFFKNVKFSNISRF